MTNSILKNWIGNFRTQFWTPFATFISDECLETSWTDLVAFIFQKLCFCSSIIVFQYGFEPTPPPTPEEEESEEEQDEDEDGLTGGEDDGAGGRLVVVNKKQWKI